MIEKFFSRQNYLSNLYIYIYKKKVILVIERI